MTWKDPAPLSIISGGQPYLCRREKDNALAGARATDRRIVQIPAANIDDIEEIVLTPSVFTIEEVLLIVEGAEKLPRVDLLLAHHEAGENEIAVVLLFKGNVPKKDPFKDLPSSIPRFEFPLPKPWDVEKEAVSFIVSEAERHGLRMARKQAAIYTALVGTNYGVLSLEVLKAATLAKAEGSQSIERTHVGRTIALVFNEDAFPIVKSLAAKDVKTVLRQLKFIHDSSGQDPTMKICGLLGTMVRGWLSAVSLLSGGYSPDEAAQRLSIHPYRFKQEFVPVSRKWKTKALADLLRGIASVERGVKTGRANPWIELNSLISRACAA